MKTFAEHLFTSLEKGLQSLDPNDVYAIGLQILCEEDDLRRPALRLLANTRANAAAHSPINGQGGRGIASDAMEAQWADAFWTEKCLAGVGIEYPWFEGEAADKAGLPLRKAWIKGLGLWYSDSLEEKDFEAAMQLGEQIGAQFDELCLDAARRLHAVITARCGHDLPIIFFSRESPDHESIALTFLANPNELLGGYAAFIRSSCGEQWASLFGSRIDKQKTSLAELLQEIG